MLVAAGSPASAQAFGAGLLPENDFAWLALAFVALLAGSAILFGSWRGRLQGRLRDTETELELTRLVIDQAADAVFWAREDGSLFYVNDAACRSVMHDRASLLKMTVPDIDPGPEAANWPEFIRDLKTTKSRRLSSFHRRRDGTVFPVDLLVTYVEHEGHGHVCGIARDLSEQHRINAALRHSESQLRAITDAVPALISYKDRNRIVRFANRAYIARHGGDEDRIIGYHEQQIWGDDPHSDIQDNIARTLRGEVTTNERTATLPDGRQRTHFATRAPHVDETGSVQGYVTVTQDITAQKEIESMLAQAQKLEAIGQLTGGIAHDFNNLLAVILGNAELLAETMPDHQANFDPIIKAARRGADLTQRLLAFSRRQPLDPKPIDLGSLIAEMHSMLSRLLGATIVVIPEIDPDAPAALADPSQLENAILNLAINAADAMPNGGTLRIVVTRENMVAGQRGLPANVPPGPYVQLAVIDTGKGMDAAVAERAIEPFFTTKGVGKGTGLGLSMIYGFATQSGGFLAIDSEPGRGTAVRLYLPMSPERPDSSRATISSRPPRAEGETVLLVEDDSDVRLLVRGILKQLGYTVMEAPTVEKAENILARANGQIDMLLSDVVLPGGRSGIDLAARIRTDHPEMGILMMSGYPAHSAEGPAEHLHDLPLLSKPFTRDALAFRLRAVLDGQSRKTGRAESPCRPAGQGANSAEQPEPIDC